MDRKLFIIGATLFLSFFVSYNRALPFEPYDETVVDDFFSDLEYNNVANVNTTRLSGKITDGVMLYLHLWQDIKVSWLFTIHSIVDVQVSAKSTTSSSHVDPSTADRKKASELIHEFAEDLEWSEVLNATRFNEIANKVSPAVILGDFVEWKASKLALLQKIRDFIEAGGIGTISSSKNLLDYLNRQYIRITALQIKCAHLPIPVDTTAFEKKACDNTTRTVKFFRAYNKVGQTNMLRSMYSIVVNGIAGVSSAQSMKNFISSAKSNAHWLNRKSPFPRAISNFIHDLGEIRPTTDVDIVLFDRRAAVDPALTTEFLNLYSISSWGNILREVFFIVQNGFQGMASADYMERFIIQNANEAPARSHGRRKEKRRSKNNPKTTR